jgi:hypothetical protein
MKKLIIVLLFLVGCDRRATITTEDGKRGVYAECSYGSMISCYEYISKICPNGYVVKEQGLAHVKAECK